LKTREERIRLSGFVGSGVLWVALFAMASAALAQEVMQFSDTPAAQAFAVEDYETAVVEFEQLRENNPDNTLVLRYLAISLDLVGRTDEAIGVYHEALSFDANDVAVHYHLGVTNYSAGLADGAAVAFRRVLALAPESEYGDYASQYLDALTVQHAQDQQPGAPQRFSLYVQGVRQRDNNTTSAARRGDRFEDDRTSGYLSIDYYLHRSPAWISTIGVNRYGVWYDDDLLEPLEVEQVSGNLLLQRTGTIANRGYVASIRLEHSTVDLADGERYSESDSSRLGLRVGFTENTATDFTYRFTRDEFDNKGFDPQFSSRDGDHHALGIAHTWYFAERLGQIIGGIDIERNNADGLNFDYDGVRANLALIVPLPWQLRAELKLEYLEQDYTNFVGPVRRETEATRSSIGVSRWFGQRLLASLDYSRYDEDSTYEELAYDREVVGFTLSFVY
jgi:Tfp pilus assembly protein PilF